MTKIEWTQATWSPIVGCSVVSPGCTNCYAMRMAARLEAMSVASETRTGGDPGPLFYYRDLTQDTRAGAVWTGKVRLAPEDVLTRPARWKKPRMVFVNSMSDLFHEDVPDEWIDRAFAVMAWTQHHTYQVLTKRAARMRDYIVGLPERRKMLACHSGLDWCDWPLPNVWLGVSAERQQEADERIPDLLATPAAIRFVSAEPLLGPIDFTRIEAAATGTLRDGNFSYPKRINTLTGESGHYPGRGTFQPDSHRVAKLSWIIVGGESGPGARPMHPDWARSIRDQCAAAGVSFFFKQWGEWAPPGDWYADHPVSLPLRAWDGERWTDSAGSVGDDDWVVRVGKSRAGRLLDGREHNHMPRTESADA